MDRSNLASPLNDPIISRLGYLLRRASSAMMADLGRGLAEIGLRPVEATILILVGANPGCIQSDLGRVLGIKRANMAPLISSLAAKGYLAKSPVDGRSLALSLTDAGEAMRSRADAIMDEHERRFDEILNGCDQGPLRAMLTAIAAKGEDQSG